MKAAGRRAAKEHVASGVDGKAQQCRDLAADLVDAANKLNRRQAQSETRANLRAI
jgi:hypothetical protein